MAPLPHVPPPTVLQAHWVVSAEQDSSGAAGGTTCPWLHVEHFYHASSDPGLGYGGAVSLGWRGSSPGMLGEYLWILGALEEGTPVGLPLRSALESPAALGLESDDEAEG